MNTTFGSKTASAKTLHVMAAVIFTALLGTLGSSAWAAGTAGFVPDEATNSSGPGVDTDFSLDPTAMEKTVGWSIDSLNATGCNSGDIEFSTTVSGTSGPPTRFRTIAEAAGLRYMDEAFATNFNGPHTWSLYGLSSGGPTTGSFPLPLNTQISVKFNFISDVYGRSIFSRHVVLDRCNGGSIISNVVACVEDGLSACLLEGRFRVSVRFRGAFDNQPVDTSALRKTVSGFNNSNFETAFFYFNSPDNIEVMVKMLDQGNTNSIGQRTIAVITGSATPLRTEVTIVDGWTGLSKVYTSPFNTQVGKTDFVAFVK